MTTASSVLLKVDATPDLGLHEAGGKAKEALDRVVVHAGQSTPKRRTRKRRDELSEKALAMLEAYPDARCAVGGVVRGNSPKSTARAAAEAQRFASMPRCRCGLLLPCLDCLPEHAPEFQEQRMFRADVTMPEGSDGLSSTRMQGTPACLSEKDARAASCYSTTGKRGRPKKTSGYDNMRKQNPEEFPLVDSGT